MAPLVGCNVRRSQQVWMALSGRLAAYLERDSDGDSSEETPGLATMIEDFLKGHAAIVVDAISASEAGAGVGHVAQEIHQSFLQLIEGYLGGFLEEEGLDPEEQGDIAFVQALLRSWEFESFVQLAVDFQQEMEGGQDEEDGDDDAGAEEEDEKEVTVDYEGHRKTESL